MIKSVYSTIVRSEYKQGSRRSQIAVFGGLIGAFMAILDIQITNASMREIQASIGATLQEGSWIATAYLVAEMIAIPLSGWLSQGLSIRRYLLWTTGAFIGSSILCSMAWDLNSMIVFRGMQGFFGGALIPLAFRLIMELLPKEKHTLGFTLFSIAATFAPTIGPTLGGWLTAKLGWEYLFYINIIPGVCVIRMLGYGLQHKPINMDILKKVDLTSIATMAIGIGCLEVVIEEGNNKDWFGSELIRYLTIIAIINIAIFFYLQLKRQNPLVNIRLLAQRDFALSNIAFFLMGMGLFGAIYLIPLYLIQMHNYTPLDVGLVLMWMGFPQLLILPFIPKLLKIIDGRYLVAFGFTLFAISFYMNSHMTMDFSGDQMIPSLIVRAIGQPFIMVSLSSIATRKLKPEDNASASTVINVVRNFGGACGIALVGTLVDILGRINLARIKESVLAVDLNANEFLSKTSNLLIEGGSDQINAKLQSKAILGRIMFKQANIVAYNNIFLVMSFCILIAAFAVLMIRKPNKKED